MKEDTFDRKEHWENIYNTKKFEEVGWYQKLPKISLDLIDEHAISPSSRVIDVGAGDSFLVDHLMDKGFACITILDISEKAIDRAKDRLGIKANEIDWIVSDIVDLQTEKRFDLWHDRAAFHFLTSDEDIEKYVSLMEKVLVKGAFVLIGCFSQNGPKKCSGIPITQYSEDSLTKRFGDSFEKLSCFYTDHITPSGGIQNYVICSFKKK